MKNKVEKKQTKTRTAVASAASQKEYKQLRKKAFKNKDKPKKHFIVIMLRKVMVTLLIIIAAVVFVFTSGAFNISEIIVEENSGISSEQIISFSGVQNGTNIFSLSKKDVIAKLKENPYINNVKVKRVFPDKIKLIVDERKLEYILPLANSYVYINRQGYILEISNNKPSVPIILGCGTDLSNIKPNNRLNEDDLNRMNMVIKIMETAEKNGISELINKIDISDAKNYTIYLDGEGKIAYLGNGTELNTRFLYIKAILKEQKGKYGEIFVNIDLNSQYVYFREKI